MDSLAHAKIDYARQLGALPWRIGRQGQVEFLMVTSRISKHWLIPKGWPMSGKSAPQAALQEAFEEAGIKGKASPKALGRYTYVKIMKDGSSVPCAVKVFGLRVDVELNDWPEMTQRERRWFTPAEAARAVTEVGLAAFLASVEVPLVKPGKKTAKADAGKRAA